MSEPSTDTRPRLNLYGMLSIASVLGAVGTLLIDGSITVSLAFVGVAGFVIAVAMRRNARSKERELSDDDDTGTDDTEMKAKGMVGGEGGFG